LCVIYLFLTIGKIYLIIICNLSRKSKSIKGWIDTVHKTYYNNYYFQNKQTSKLVRRCLEYSYYDDYRVFFLKNIYLPVRRL